MVLYFGDQEENDKRDNSGITDVYFLHFKRKHGGKLEGWELLSLSFKGNGYERQNYLDSGGSVQRSNPDSLMI